MVDNIQSIGILSATFCLVVVCILEAMNFFSLTKKIEKKFKIENEEKFVYDIIHKYKDYADFSTSEEYNRYISYFNNNPDIIESIKRKFDGKSKSFFKYKIVKY